MLSDDLAAAAAAGIITAEQAGKLATFLQGRALPAGVPAAATTAYVSDEDPDEESFRFARGFQDVFLTIGVTLLLVGIGIGGPMVMTPIAAAFAGAVIAFALAFIFATRKRLVLPSIATAIGFTVFAGIGMALVIGGNGWDLIGGWSEDNGGRGPLIAGLAALVASGLFYAVFRLPFALALMALSLIPTVFGIEVLYFNADVINAWLPTLLGLGIAAFIAAMAFDLSDPLRRTIRADNAFWLHLVAAPLIVHSVIGLVTVSGRLTLTVEDAVIVIAVVLGLGLVAVIVDRRALLVAGLGSLAIAVGRLFSAADMTSDGVVAGTLIVVGAGVVALGFGWRPIRHALLGGFPRRGLLLQLPPA